MSEIQVGEPRHGWSAGLLLESLARLLAEDLGASDALNLDGGGSSALWLGGKLRDRPEGAFECSIHNGLRLWLLPPAQVEPGERG